MMHFESGLVTSKKWDFSRQCGSKTARKNFKPLCTFPELAEKLGVLKGQLQYAIRVSPIPVPAPELVTGGRQWYSFDTMKAWWDAIDGKKIAVSEKADYYRDWLKKQAVNQSSVTEAA